MIELNTDADQTVEIQINGLPVSVHSACAPVYERLKRWFRRFSQAVDPSIFSDMCLLFFLATKKFLDHRSPAHLFRVILSVHYMQKKLLHAATFQPRVRHLEIRWIPTSLLFPFSSKPVLGCLIGFNVLDRYELFDEENILLALQKYLPDLRLVKESFYCHTSQHKNLKIFYLEIEKKDGACFSLKEQNVLKSSLEKKISKSIQQLSPTIFMGNNDEEIYKNILVLSKEIQSLQDLPQVYITLSQQTGKAIIFRITLVHISPFHRFSLKERFADEYFLSERTLTVKHFENHPIKAHIFCVRLPRDPSLLRSDGSLDFYSARKKVVSLLTSAIGEFRDYNGGILVKQQELLLKFKEEFPELAIHDPELMESFFYALAPLEKQVVLPEETLVALFSYFLENRQEKLKTGAIDSFKIYRGKVHTFLVIRAGDSSLTSEILKVLQEPSFAAVNIVYNFIDTVEGVFFNAVILEGDSSNAENMIQVLQESVLDWHKKMKNRQVLRVGLEYSLASLDPRIGGESMSSNILRLLFEGLTRFNQSGNIENAAAESIEISPNRQHYTFRLRPCLWNDGSRVSAHDFEYAWKKILSPDFKTAFAYLFYSIKNAKEAKEGKVHSDEIGIKAVDDRTLTVELVNPTPYFLQLTSSPLFSPVHRLIDQQHPQWPYQCEEHYPCNGPFQLKFNQPNQGYQLVKNPLYWEAEQVVLDQITLIQMNPVQAYQAFQQKEIDWIGNPFGGWHAQYNSGKEGRIISVPNSWVCWLVFNTAQPPFNHRKMRQAFAYAVQRSLFAVNAFLPMSSAYSPLLPDSIGSNHPLFPEYDPEKARHLFHEALEEIGMSKKDLNTLDLVFVEKGIREHGARCLQKQLGECLGIEQDLKPLSWRNLFDKMSKGDFQLGLMQWFSWVDDPIYTLNSFKSPELNFSQWENAEFQRLIHLSEQEINPYQRSSYLLKAEEILSHEMPIVPLFYHPHLSLVSKDLHITNPTQRAAYQLAKSYYKKKEN